jgi:hypothetical protein
MTHSAIKFMVLVLFGMFGLSGYAAAVSYPVLEDQREVKAAKGIREKGETVCLFQSGTEDVRKTIGIGDVLIVYREGGDREHREVGKIKVLSYAGEDYIKAEVVDGAVQTGDVARKGNVASLVISSSEQCK